MTPARGFLPLVLVLLIAAMLVLVSGAGWWMTSRSAMGNQNSVGSSTLEGRSGPQPARVTITTPSPLYVGFENPYEVAGTARGLKLVHVALQSYSPVGSDIFATATVPVVAGKWSLVEPENYVSMENLHGVYVFAPSDPDFSPTATNTPLASKQINVRTVLSPDTLTQTSLSGTAFFSAVQETNLTNLDVAIYRLVFTGGGIVAHAKIGALVYRASSTPIHYSACPRNEKAPRCVVTWSIPLSPSSPFQPTEPYEIRLYAPGHYTVPLSGGSLGLPGGQG